MKTDIYDILARHFNRESSAEEEEKVQVFRKEYPQEYQNLQRIWNAKAKIEVHDFDSRIAWNKVKQQIATPSSKVVPMYRKWLRVAAAVAVLLVSSLVVYQYLQTEPALEMASTTATTETQLVQLADGSKVWLNRNATLHYPTKFGRKKREVTLKGEAFFDIQRDEQKPFVVQTHNAQTTVLGTSFNIVADTLLTDVTVATGKVEVSNRIDEKVVLTPGQVANVQAEKITKTNNDDPNFLAWKTGEFTFSDTPFQQVIEALNTYYTDQFKPTAVEGCELNATFKQAKIESVIETIETICQKKFAKVNGQWELR